MIRRLVLLAQESPHSLPPLGGGRTARLQQCRRDGKDGLGARVTCSCAELLKNLISCRATARLKRLLSERKALPPQQSGRLDRTLMLCPFRHLEAAMTSEAQ
eukprot:scaffold1805_cov248-Pinguiococcus_pyrenoidosus.AAC.3